MLTRRFTLRHRAGEHGEAHDPGVGQAGRQDLRSSTTAGPVAAAATPSSRRTSRSLRSACFLAVGLLVSGASAGLAAVPAQAAGGTPGISAPPNVVVGEADGTITLPVTLSAASSSQVTVNYATSNGSASNDTSCGRPTDVYESNSGTLTFNPNVTTQNVTVSLLNCNASLSSGFYTFYLNLSTPSTGATIVRAATQIDVTGDTAASSTPGLFVKNAVVDATVGSIQVPVLLGGPSGAAQGVPVTVNYATANGSAKSGTDYTATSGTLTFPAGETAQNITVPILDPSGSEPTRSFSVTLSSPSNATIATGTGTVTIGASGATAVSNPLISAPANVVVGQADGYIELPVTLNAPSNSTSPVTVNYATSNGSASNDTSCGRSTDAYQLESGTLTFTPGVTTQVVRVPLLNCDASLSSGFYTFYLNLSTPSTGATIVRAATQIDVTGDTAASSTPGLFVKNAVVDATAGSIQVPVLLGGPSGAAQGVPVTVNYATANGSAKSGTDYTATSGTLTFPAGETAQNITVPILDPSGSEPTRSFSVTLSSPSNATIATGTGTVTIGASGATAVSNPLISAPANVVVGQADGYIELPVTLNAPSNSTSPVTVNYATSNGSASNDTSCGRSTDAYQLESGTLTFTPGVTTQVVRVPLLNCDASLSSGFYTFYLNLSTPSTGATIVRAATQIDVTGDTAASSTPGLFVKNAVVDATVGSIQVPVLLGGPSGAAQGVPVTVNYATANGSAKSGTDYTATSGTLTFPAGETAQNITVPILDPSGSEPTRSFSVTLSSPSNATIATGTGTVTIGASGATAVSNPLISAPANVVVGQADGYIELPVTLNAPSNSTSPVTVNYATSNGSASNDTSCGRSTDAYQLESGTLTFTPGVTTQVVRVPLLNCDTTQALTFTLNLSGAVGGTISNATTTITVANFPTITSFSPTSGAPGTKVTIKGTNLGDVVSVSFNGTAATVKKDTASKVKVVVPAGAKTGKITITTIDGSVTSTTKFKVT